MASIYDEGCCEMLKLEASECYPSTKSWDWVANIITFGQVFIEQKSLVASWILLIEALEDHKSLEIIVETWDRLEKILVI